MTIDTWIRIWRAGFAIAFFGASQFVICCVVSMIVYPGGSLEDGTSDNYSLSANYLSDLGREVSISGQNNTTGSRIFNASLILLGFCSFPFFFFMPTHAWDKVGWLSVAAVAGSFTAVSLIVMGSFPCDVAPVMHFLGLFFWMVMLFFSASIHAASMLTSKEPISVALSMVSVGVAMLAAAYFYHGTETAAAVFFGREIPLKSVLLQKLLVIASMIWLFSVSAKMLLTADFSEYRERDLASETEEYLQEVAEEPWAPRRR